MRKKFKRNKHFLSLRNCQIEVLPWLWKKTRLFIALTLDSNIRIPMDIVLTFLSKLFFLILEITIENVYNKL